MAGANLIYGMGMLEMGMACSLTQLVMDDEIAAMVKRVVAGVPMDDERMGVDLIKAVGIGGNFLTQRHSMEYLMSEQSQPTIIDRRMRGGWEKRGSKTLAESARERARKLRDSHQPKPLEQEMVKELNKIIESTEKKG